MSNQPDWTAVSQRAEAILGQPILSVEQLSDDDRRNLLLRCTLAQPPYSVIIKQTLPTDDPDKLLAQDQLRFWQDWAGAALLTAVSDTHISPKFYGGDTALSFIILEDLGTGSSLVEPLLEGDAQSAEAALRQMMTRLGQMHAAAIDQAQTYEDILHTLDDQAAERVQQSLPDFAELPAKFADLGVAVAGFEQELAQVRTAVSTTLSTPSANDKIVCTGQMCRTKMGGFCRHSSASAKKSPGSSSVQMPGSNSATICPPAFCSSATAAGAKLGSAVAMRVGVIRPRGGFRGRARRCAASHLPDAPRGFGNTAATFPAADARQIQSG